MLYAREKDIYLPELATITKRRMLNGTELYMHLQLDGGQEMEYTPGQFVEVSLAGIGEAPISISSTPTQRGWSWSSVTSAPDPRVHKLDAGTLGVRGLMARPTPLNRPRAKTGLRLRRHRAGAAAVVHPIRLDNRTDYGKVTVLLGTKCYDMRLFREEIAMWMERKDMCVMETIDEAHDCWNGNVGVVTTLIPKIENELPNSLVMVCGPPVMYKFVLMALAEADVPQNNIFVNLERRMKCGVGKCGHCQINQHYVCQDGPVFRYSDLADVPEAI